MATGASPVAVHAQTPLAVEPLTPPPTQDTAAAETATRSDPVSSAAGFSIETVVPMTIPERPVLSEMVAVATPAPFVPPQFLPIPEPPRFGAMPTPPTRTELGPVRPPAAGGGGAPQTAAARPPRLGPTPVRPDGGGTGPAVAARPPRPGLVSSPSAGAAPAIDDRVTAAEPEPVQPRPGGHPFSPPPAAAAAAGNHPFGHAGTPPAAAQVAAVGTTAAPLPGTEVVARRLVYRPSSQDPLDTGGLDAVLDQVARMMAETPSLRLQLESYASGTVDTEIEARRMSLRRALALREWLVELGIRRTRIDVRPLGATAPDDPADRVDLIPVP